MQSSKSLDNSNMSKLTIRFIRLIKKEHHSDNMLRNTLISKIIVHVPRFLNDLFITDGHVYNLVKEKFCI